VSAHLTTQVAEDLVPVLQFYAELGAGQAIYHGALNLNLVVLGHRFPPFDVVPLPTMLATAPGLALFQLSLLSSGAADRFLLLDPSQFALGDMPTLATDIA
jgi:hypothetical protein